MTVERQREVRVGQTWGLWVYDDAMYERLTILDIRDNTAYGHTGDGNQFVVGLNRLRESGDLLGEEALSSGCGLGVALLLTAVFVGVALTLLLLWALGVIP